MADDSIILSCTAQRLASHELGEDGRVVVLQPRFGFAPLQRLMVRCNRPFVRVKLDELGSFVWLRAEGRTVRQIAEELAAQWGDRIPDAPARTVGFFRSLVRSGLVRLQRPL